MAAPEPVRFWLIFALLASSVAAADVFSPGPLARSHANLEGIQNCTRCHEAGARLSVQKCLACHTELKSRVTNGQGYHGRLSSQQLQCEGCHREHEGRDDAMVVWLPSKKLFPHQDTGWPLKGKHAQLKCEACHQPRRIEAADVKAWVAGHPSDFQTFLGLPTACVACHFDEHRAQLGTNCARCHNESGWKPAPGFRHDQTDYPLTGKHRQVACKRCHAPEQDETTPADAFPAPLSRQYAKYTELPHASCLDCHQDPHQGKFGERCESCHTTAGWTTVQGGGRDLRFHDATRYPLRGAHVAVPCKACHGPWPGHAAQFKNLKFEQCTDCHLDAHEGQLAVAAPERKRPQPCEGCHTVDGFVPARFTLADHQRTLYPLEGAHAAVPCNACHARDPKLARALPQGFLALVRRKELLVKNDLPILSLVRFHPQGSTQRCETCHQDPHAGQFTVRGDSKTCDRCHQVTAFSALLFNHQRDSSFALTGKHRTTACGACHTPRRINGVETVRYRPLSAQCASCHGDVHGGQFLTAQGRLQDCSACHGTNSFQQLLFRHGPPFTRFVLEGKHAQTPCQGCHPAVTVAGGKAIRRYVGVPTACADCHTDFHHGELQGFTP